MGRKIRETVFSLPEGGTAGDGSTEASEGTGYEGAGTNASVNPETLTASATFSASFAPGPTGTGETASQGDPEAPLGRHPDGRPRKRKFYQRRAGGTASSASQGAGRNSQASLAGFADLLVFAHTVLKNVTGIPELEIDEDEAKEIEKASAKVAAHYNVVIDPKTADWVKLTMVLSTVYGTRLLAYRNRTSREKKVHPIRAAE